MTGNEAIEELKCYRAKCGTEYPEEVEVAISAIFELQKYKKIGTVEECREAMEKQRAKKLVLSEYIGDAIAGLCPVCSSEFTCVIPREYKAGGFGYCKQCGQKLDWSEDK